MSRKARPNGVRFRFFMPAGRCYERRRRTNQSSQYRRTSRTSRSCEDCSAWIRNMSTIEINNAIKVELKATPRLWVTPVISPSTARCACPRALPIPRTVPINPTDGIAQAIYRMIESSDLCAPPRHRRLNAQRWMRLARCASPRTGRLRPASRGKVDNPVLRVPGVCGSAMMPALRFRPRRTRPPAVQQDQAVAAGSVVCGCGLPCIRGLKAPTT